jgi:hypothetical protein
LDRITEDEVAALAAGGGTWASLNRSWDDQAVRDIADVTNDTRRLFALPMDYDEHIARHDPARVLAQCAALRAVVEMHTAFVPPMGFFKMPTDTLRALASIWDDHESFDPAWRLG